MGLWGLTEVGRRAADIPVIPVKHGILTTTPVPSSRHHDFASGKVEESVDPSGVPYMPFAGGIMGFPASGVPLSFTVCTRFFWV